MLEHYSFHSLELRGSYLFQHDDAPVHIKTKVGVEELVVRTEPRALNPTDHVWDEFERRLCA